MRLVGASINNVDITFARHDLLVSCCIFPGKPEGMGSYTSWELL
jgi:hypothetical protein